MYLGPSVLFLQHGIIVVCGDQSHNHRVRSGFLAYVEGLGGNLGCEQAQLLGQRLDVLAEYKVIVLEPAFQAAGAYLCPSVFLVQNDSARRFRTSLILATALLSYSDAERLSAVMAAVTVKPIDFHLLIRVCFIKTSEVYYDINM